MATSLIKPSLAAGELAPSLWGRVDLDKFHIGASVLRNMCVNYRGGVFSRGGLAFSGQCLQAGTASPPRIISFRFNIFQNYILEFGDKYMRVAANGAYVTEAAFNITSISRANPAVADIPGNNFAAGDWLFLASIGGMFELNTRTVVVRSVAGASVAFNDTFGNPINSLDFAAYTGGGTAARIFTLTTPYAAVDLPYLKYTQSADVMSLCLVNQQTGVEYQFQDLKRIAANIWTMAPPSIGTSVAAPGSPTATASTSGATAYGYVVTAVNEAGEESIASDIAAVTSAVDIASTFGTITVAWDAVADATSYNIYRATPDYTNTGDFTGQLFGYVGSTQGALTWNDTNIIPDFTTTPPLGLDPFSGAGNAPAAVTYFQQRRWYLGSLNFPDDYNASQPGLYTNFDSADPPIDSDAISGNPWAQQVNGIQCALPMPGGMLVGTGLDMWLLSGTGGPGTPVTPSQQSAQPQDSYGFSASLDPIRIGWHALYVPQAGTSIQDVAYNFWANIYAGTEISILSSHLFINYQINSWALARQPYKIIWIVRNDGKALSLTYLAEQQINGIARHDTQGLFVSNAVATEPPADAPYFVVKRFIPGPNQWAYYLERMDNRSWANVEQCFCVDAGLALPQPTPDATLTASSAEPLNGVAAGPVIVGGADYSSGVTARIDDPTGVGAVVGTITVVAGVITAYEIAEAGEGYTQPVIVFTDATGSGAQASVLVDQSVTFTADANVFSSGDVGSVLRMGGGIATVTSVPNALTVVTQMTQPITATLPMLPDGSPGLPLPAASGEWTLTPPVTQISGLDHLDGCQVTGLADGQVIPLSTVEDGAITLPAAASAVSVGLPFIAQVQTMHTDLGGAETNQGRATKVVGVTLRVEASRDFQIGQDQPIASQQPNQAEYPWPNMANVKSGNPASPKIGPIPLFTGDRYVPIEGDFNVGASDTPNDSVYVDGEAPRAPGMVAVQQMNPLPLSVLAAIPKVLFGDSPDPRDLQ